MMTMSMKMMTVMTMTTTMMTMNGDDDDDDDDDDFGGGGGGNGDDLLHDKTVKDNESSRFLLHTCVVSLFSPGVIKLCACLFLDMFHTIYRNTRVLFGSFIITKLSSKCSVFAFLFGFILVLK